MSNWSPSTKNNALIVSWKKLSSRIHFHLVYKCSNVHFHCFPTHVQTKQKWRLQMELQTKNRESSTAYSNKQYARQLVKLFPPFLFVWFWRGVYKLAAFTYKLAVFTYKLVGVLFVGIFCIIFTYQGSMKFLTDINNYDYFHHIHTSIHHRAKNGKSIMTKRQAIQWIPLV